MKTHKKFPETKNSNMKLLSCILLVSALLYVNALTLKTISTKCGNGLRKCPEGTKQAFYGKNMLNSECFCERLETKEEAERRRQSERPERCQTAIDQCETTDYQYNNYHTLRTHGCDTMVNTCDPEDLEDVCANLKKRNTPWQCLKWLFDAIEKSKKDKAAKEEAEKNAKAEQEQAEQNKKSCAYAETECYNRGRGFVNTNNKSRTCEDFVRTCPKDKVKTFCTKHLKAGGFTCARSPAYKKRFA